MKNYTVFTSQKQRDQVGFLLLLLSASLFILNVFSCDVQQKIYKIPTQYFLYVALSMRLTVRALYFQDRRIHFHKICYREILPKFFTCIPKYVYIIPNKFTIMYHNSMYHNSTSIYI
jgi:hypothetical protein